MTLTMINVKLERLADEIRSAMHAEIPIDPIVIAKEEGIVLGAGQFGEGFTGRIEFHPEHGKFVLFYPEAGNPRRIRFSLAHELGHYYIEEHRRLLVGGKSHNSSAGFICDDRLEREADLFAAALLIPRRYIESKSRSLGFMTLARIIKMADDCNASITCAAIRYAQCTEEACAVVLSQDGTVLYGIASDEMDAIGFRVVKRGIPVPVGSPTARCMASADVRSIAEGRSKSLSWFANPYREVDLWEEAIPLGYANQCLTLLAKESSKDEEE